MRKLNSSITGLVRTSRAMRSASASAAFGLQAVLQRQHKVLALAHVGDALVFHPPQSIRDRLALRIQDGTFQCDIDMSLHRV